MIRNPQIRNFLVSLSVFTMVSTTLFGCFNKNGAVVSNIPTVQQQNNFVPPTVTPFTLATETPVWLVEDHSLPLVSIQIVLPGGSISDPEGQWGRAEIVSQMLLEASGSMTATDISKYFYQKAVEISVETRRQHTVIEIAAHKNRLQEIMPVVQAVIADPKFQETDWNRVVEQHGNALQQSHEDASWLASQYAGYFLYGDKHPLGHPVDGEIASIAKIDRNASAAWHKSRLFAKDVKIVAVGDISSADIVNLFESYLQSWSTMFPAASSIPAVPVAEFTPSTKTILVDMPGAEQTAIRVFSPAYVGTEDQISAQLAGIVMGGSFTSRLNALLREEKGYTYGAGCSFSESTFGNYFVVRTSVQTAVTGPALQDMFAVLATAKEGFSAEEEQKAFGTFQTGFVETVASRKKLSEELVDNLLLGESVTSMQEHLQRAKQVGAVDMLSMSKYFDTNRGIVLLIGDASAVEPQLQAIGVAFEKASIPE